MSDTSERDLKRSLYLHKVKLNNSEYYNGDTVHSDLDALYCIDYAMGLYGDERLMDIAKLYPESSAVQNERIAELMKTIGGDGTLPPESDFYYQEADGRFHGKLRDTTDQFGNKLARMQLSLRKDLRGTISIMWQELSRCYPSGEFMFPEYFIKVSDIPQGIYKWINMNPNENGYYLRKDLAYWLSVLAVGFGQELDIHVGLRGPKRNKAAGGATNSFHLSGTAVDIHMSIYNENGRATRARKKLREDFASQAHMLGFGGIGMYDTFIHLDIGPYSRWSDDVVETFYGPAALGGQVYPEDINDKTYLIESEDPKETIHEEDMQ